MLRPIAEHRGLNTWEKLTAYAIEEWHPLRLAFGKYKGRLFREAQTDAELRRWLEWLAGSSNTRSAKMGRWYLRQVEIETELEADSTVFAAPGIESGNKEVAPASEGGFAGLLIYVGPELERLRQFVAGARARLAELEVSYAKDKSRVQFAQGTLFRLLREHYQKRDRLRLLVDYRKKYLDSLTRGGEEEAQQTEENYEKAKEQADKDYQETAATVARQRELTEEEEAELARLWRKLVKLYHPDRFAHEPDMLETYAKLTAAINRAKDSGDIATLREIAEDPHGFIVRQGWATLDFSEEVELAQLHRMYETLQLEIITVIESLNRLRESPEYELSRISEQKPGVLDELAVEKTKQLEKEIQELDAEANRLDEEIRELSGQAPSRIL